jgi:acyl-CoA synthetase (AMP-forming)/AMP-acid ligase II
MVAEPTADDPVPEIKQCTYLLLYSMVADLASALLSNGVRPGDRVASYSSNCIVRSSCLGTSILGDSPCSDREWGNEYHESVKNLGAFWKMCVTSTTYISVTTTIGKCCRVSRHYCNWWDLGKRCC